MVELKKSDDNKFIADFFESGISITIYINSFYLNYEVKVPSCYKNTTRGIFGNFDGDRAVEFFARGSNEYIPYPVNTRPDSVVYTPLLSCKMTISA